MEAESGGVWVEDIHVGIMSFQVVTDSVNTDLEENVGEKM